eukprot:3672252-Alexandrium_andersonii.AAC.1
MEGEPKTVSRAARAPCLDCDTIDADAAVPQVTQPVGGAPPPPWQSGESGLAASVDDENAE